MFDAKSAKADAPKVELTDGQLVSAAAKTLEKAKLHYDEEEASNQGTLPDNLATKKDDPAFKPAPPKLLHGVEVKLENRTNRKDPVTDNQDAVDAFGFDADLAAHFATYIKAIQASYKITGETLIREGGAKYYGSGASATVVLVVKIAANKILVTSGQIGDTTGCFIPKPGQFIALTPSHNAKFSAASPTVDGPDFKEFEAARARIKADIPSNDLLVHDDGVNVTQTYLFDGCSIYVPDKIPSAEKLYLYLGGFILLIDEMSSKSSFHYVHKDSKGVLQISEVEITNKSKFDAMLASILKNNDERFELFADGCWSRLNTERQKPPNKDDVYQLAFRLTNDEIHELVMQCCKLESFIKLPPIRHKTVAATGMIRTFGRPTLNHHGELFEPEVSQAAYHCDAQTRVAVFSDGLFETEFKPSYLATLIHQGIAGEVVYKSGGEDDIGTAVASRLDKLPVGKGVGLIGIDANGPHGAELAKRAMQLLTENLSVSLSIKNGADAKVSAVVTIAGATAAGATAASASMGAAAGISAAVGGASVPHKNEVPLVVNPQLLTRGVVTASEQLQSQVVVAAPDAAGVGTATDAAPDKPAIASPSTK